MGILSILGIAPVIALAAALNAAPPARAGGPPNPQDLVKAELVAETPSVAPATTLWVDLHLIVKPGWHVYWRNPGNSGLPTTIEWKLPPGFSAGGILWPVPERFVQAGIGNYGYAGSADLLVPIHAAKELAVGETAMLGAEASLARLRRYLHSRRRQALPEPARRGSAGRARSRPPRRFSPLSAGGCRVRPRSRAALLPMPVSTVCWFRKASSQGCATRPGCFSRTTIL